MKSLIVSAWNGGRALMTSRSRERWTSFLRLRAADRVVGVDVPVIDSPALTYREDARALDLAGDRLRVGVGALLLLLLRA